MKEYRFLLTEPQKRLYLSPLPRFSRPQRRARSNHIVDALSYTCFAIERLRAKEGHDPGDEDVCR